MFEIIGMVVVAGIAWVVFKGMLSGVYEGSRLKTVESAESYGVPYEFAMEIASNSKLLRDIHRSARKFNTDIAALNVYEQYGIAIATLYKGIEEKERVDNDLLTIQDNDMLTLQVGLILCPQIDKIKSQGKILYVDDVVFAYILMMSIHITNRAVTLLEVKNVLEILFDHPDETQNEHIISQIANYYLIVSRNFEDFSNKCVAFEPLVKREVACGKGEYYEKYNNKIIEAVEDKFNRDESYDPSTAPFRNFLDV